MKKGGVEKEEGGIKEGRTEDKKKKMGKGVKRKERRKEKEKGEDKKGEKYFKGRVIKIGSENQ